MDRRIKIVMEKDDKLYSLATKTTGKKIKVQKIPFGMSGIKDSNEIEEQDDDDAAAVSTLTRKCREEIERDLQIYADTGETDSSYIEDYTNTYGADFVPDITNFFDNY